MPDAVASTWGMPVTDATAASNAAGAGPAGGDPAAVHTSAGPPLIPREVGAERWIRRGPGDAPAAGPVSALDRAGVVERGISR